MATNKYIATDKRTDEGEVIYHLQTGCKGRPKMFTKSAGNHYTHFKRPLVKKVKVADPVVADPVTA
jgi:hypothetical protein